MSRSHKGRAQAWAVVRLDLPLEEGGPPERISVKEVVSTRELAEREASRLNTVSSHQGSRYFATPTRVFPAGQSAGEELDS